MRRKRIFKILLLISLLPYVFLVLYSLYNAIFGYKSYTWILPHYLGTIYGWDAFLQVFILTGFVMLFTPIIPVCLSYQLIYLAQYLIRKIRNRIKISKDKVTN